MSQIQAGIPVANSRQRIHFQVLAVIQPVPDFGRKDGFRDVDIDGGVEHVG